VGLDHELTPTISIGARYVHKRLLYAIEDVGVLLPSSPSNPGGIEVYFIANPGFGVTQVLLPITRTTRRRSRSATTTASSSACANGSPTTGP